MADPQSVVIVDASGNEHHFPAGFDPKKAGAIVRAQGSKSQAKAAPAPERTWGDTAIDVAKGIGKGAIHSGLDMAQMAAMSGMIPGLSTTSLPSQVVDRGRELTPYRNDPQKVGGAIETAAELYSPAKALVRGLPAAARAIGPTALNIAEHVPVIGKPVRMLRMLSSFLEKAEPSAAKAATSAAETASNTGGRLVREKSPSLNSVLSDALEDVRAPEPAMGVELPPQPSLPAGYTPRTSAPAPVAQTGPTPTPQLRGRLVSATPKPTAEQEVAEALAEVRQTPAAMPRVTTAPQAELPPGYTPRSTVPKAAAPKPTATPEPAAPRSRAYFLKPEADAAAAAPKNAPLTLEDLPAAWKTMTAPPTIAPRTIGGSELAGSYAQELIRRGVKPAAALKAVRNDPSIPPEVKSQIMAALSAVAKLQ